MCKPPLLIGMESYQYYMTSLCDVNNRNDVIKWPDADCRIRSCERVDEVRSDEAQLARNVALCYQVKARKITSRKIVCFTFTLHHQLIIL